MPTATESGSDWQPIRAPEVPARNALIGDVVQAVRDCSADEWVVFPIETPAGPGRR